MRGGTSISIPYLGGGEGGGGWDPLVRTRADMFQNVLPPSIGRGDADHGIKGSAYHPVDGRGPNQPPPPHSCRFNHGSTPLCG